MSSKESPTAKSGTPAGGKFSAKARSAKRAGRPRLIVLGDFELLIHDPYLLDAIRQFSRVLSDLLQCAEAQQIENDIYLLCELSRDITIRLIPFSAEMVEVIRHAKGQYEKALASLKDKQSSQNIVQYAANIQKRAEEYAEFLEKNDKSAEGSMKK